MNILFIPTGNSGISYWRFFNYWVGMSRNGQNSHLLWWQSNSNETHPWERDVFDSSHKWRIIKEMEAWAIQADVIVFGMLHGPGVKIISADTQEYVNQSMALFLGMKDMFPNKPILSEVDDNLISTPPYNPVFDMYAPETDLRELALMQFKKSDGLIVSTPYLGEVYSEVQPNYHVIPNCIDLELWNRAKKNQRNKNGIRIGWAGGANHEEDLRIMEKVIPEITRKHRNVKFVFVHGCPHYLRSIPNVVYKNKWVDIDKYPKMLASMDFDIGIAPLEDNAFNRGKSNLRWLEYSALGIPTVASNVGHFKETIRNGEDGLLVNTIDEWVASLDLLINDRSRRQNMGLCANERIRRDFNVNEISKQYADILKAEVDIHSKRPMEAVQ